MVMAITLCLLTNENAPPGVEIDGSNAINTAVELAIEPKSGGMKGEVVCATDVVGTSIFNRNKAMKPGRQGNQLSRARRAGQGSDWLRR